MIKLKFKENDRVRVTNIRDEGIIYDIEPSYLIGKTGTIISIDYIPEINGNIDCPYELAFDDYKAKNSGNAFWEESEIELISSDEIPLYPFNLSNDRNPKELHLNYMKSYGNCGSELKGLFYYPFYDIIKYIE